VLARVHAFKELVTCTLVVSESCRPTLLHTLVVDLCNEEAHKAENKKKCGE